MRDALRAAGHRVALAVLRAPLPVCLARLQAREGEPDVDSGAIAQLWHSFADVGDFEANVLALGGEDADEVSETLARYLGDGRLRI